jgi:hypothetical protein
MPIRKLSPDQWLTLLEERAPRLIKAGIRSLSLTPDGVVVGLAEREPTQDGKGVDMTPAPQPKESSNPLHDETTYAGGVIPGFDLSGLTSDEEPS